MLSTLRAGQQVAVRERGDKFQISTTDDRSPGTHTVTEVGDDFPILRDVAGVIKMRVPVCSVKSVVAVTMN